MSCLACPSTGLRHSWQVHGPDDQLGTLNRLTGPVVAAAAASVRTGERIGLSLPLGVPDPSFFGRKAPRHTVFPMGPHAWDDRLDGFYLQASSQWDGFRHVGAGADGFYGGWQGSPRDRCRMAGHPALGEPGHHRPRGAGRPGGQRVATTRSQAWRSGFPTWSAALRAQGSELRFGDILCVRTGWVDKYLTLDSAERRNWLERLVDPMGYTCAGLAGSEEMSRFLWDSGVAAVTSDNPAVETVPVDPRAGLAAPAADPVPGLRHRGAVRLRGAGRGVPACRAV